jgi:hypothetical protein
MTTKATLNAIEDVLRERNVTEATISPAEKESLDRLGYLVLPDVIDAGWLSKLRTAFERAVDQSLFRPWPRSASVGDFSCQSLAK